MILLLLSGAEVDALLQGTADRALKEYLARERAMDALLPDDNLPVAVLLRQVELIDDGRHYVACERTFDSEEAANYAWAQVHESTPIQSTACGEIVSKKAAFGTAAEIDLPLWKEPA